MRGTTAAFLLLPVVALSAAGCGGNQIAADEVSVAPPTLAIPKDSKLAGAARPSASATPSASTTATPTAGTGTAPSGAATGAATAAPAAGGGTTGGTGTGTAPATPPANTGGASPDQDFDEFCANNPGAC